MKIDRIKKMKHPRVIIIDEATDTIICHPTKYEIMKSFIGEKNEKH